MEFQQKPISSDPWTAVQNTRVKTYRVAWWRLALTFCVFFLALSLNFIYYSFSFFFVFFFFCFFFCSELIRKKSFQSSSSYAPFCPDKTGAVSLKDYKSLQNHEQHLQFLKDCGFNEEEIQFKLEQEGHIPKVNLTK